MAKKKSKLAALAEYHEALKWAENASEASRWTPSASRPPDVGVVAGTGHVASFKTGGSTGDHTLITDGNYSDDNEGFKAAHNHYGSKAEGGGYIDQDRGHLHRPRPLKPCRS